MLGLDTSEFFLPQNLLIGYALVALKWIRMNNFLMPF